MDLKEIIILHTNDFHSKLLPDNGLNRIRQRAEYIAESRRKYENVLLLDAGDLNPGHGTSDFDLLIIEAFNIMGYDAVTFGNHEFDRGLAPLLLQMQKAIFPFLSANVALEDGTLLGQPYIIKKYGDIRLGIFGLTVSDASLHGKADGIVFLDEIECAEKAVAELKALGCDAIIALTHLGTRTDRESTYGCAVKLAKAVKGIDFILDGHSHSYMDEPMVVDGTPIVSAGDHGWRVGKLTLRIEKFGEKIFDWEFTEFDGKDTESIFPEGFFKAPQAVLDEKLAIAEDDFEINFQESLKRETSTGNLIADAMFWYAKNVIGVVADFAIINGGTLRRGFRKGDITGKELIDLVPFENDITMAEISGDEVLELFGAISSFNQGHRGWAHVSEHVKFRSVGGRLKEILINGRQVESEKKYRIVIIDFLSEYSHGYSVLRETASIPTGVNLRDAVKRYLISQKVIKPKVDGRAVFEDD